MPAVLCTIFRAVLVSDALKYPSPQSNSVHILPDTHGISRHILADTALPTSLKDNTVVTEQLKERIFAAFQHHLDPEDEAMICTEAALVTEARQLK